MSRFTTFRTGNPQADIAFGQLTDQLNKERRETCISYSTDVRTVSGSDDATIVRLCGPLTLTNLFVNVDASIGVDASNWWSLRLVFYRPGFATKFGVQPVKEFAGDEYIKTNNVPIPAYSGISIPYDQQLEKGDLLVLEFTVGAGTPTNFTKTFIQADFLAR